MMEKDLMKDVYLKPPMRIIRASTDRPEIANFVISVTTDHDKNAVWDALKNAVHAMKGTLQEEERIMVFFKDTKDADQFREETRCAVYHGKLPAFGENKAFHLDQWDWGVCPVLATSTAMAFGTHREYVKAVFIYNSSYGMQTHVQEGGRAGRAGRPSYCITIRNEACGLAVLPGRHKDPHLCSKLDVFLRNPYVCRRFQITEAMDGRTLAKSCAQVPGCNLCDVCDPEGEMISMLNRAVFGRTDTRPTPTPAQRKPAGTSSNTKQLVSSTPLPDTAAPTVQADADETDYDLSPFPSSLVSAADRMAEEYHSKV
jgi:superfamily II DNA helicase RecQ